MADEWKWIIHIVGTPKGVGMAVDEIRKNANVKPKITYIVYNKKDKMTHREMEFIDCIGENELREILQKTCNEHKLNNITVWGYDEDREPDTTFTINVVKEKEE